MEVWAVKYRPENLDGYIFQNKNHEKKFREYWDKKSFPNLLLSGTRGCGKTTIARILAKQAIAEPQDLKIINASKDNGVDFIRTTVSEFIETFSFGGLKVVLLEEGDYLSHAAQGALRVLTEDFVDSVRFILTCNYPNKLTNEFKSRFTHYHFDSMDYETMMLFMANILKAEGIEPNLDVMDHCINQAYPDLRQTITLLQDSVEDGKLVLKDFTTSNEWKELIDVHLSKGNFMEIKRLLETDIPENDIEDVFIHLYENINICPQSKDPFWIGSAQLLIADHLYKHSIVSKPQINACALMIGLGRIQ